MCVTNTVNRRSTLSLSASALQASPSSLSQRLCNSILGDLGTISVEKHVAKPATVEPPTVSTAPTVPKSFFPVVSEVKPVADSDEPYSMQRVAAAAAAPSNVEPPKRKRKRRRKPQLPGKTAKMNDRHFVVHNYHDHANDSPAQVPPPVEATSDKPRRRGGVAIAFPLKLHSLLDKIEEDGLAHVVSWQPHGRAFCVHKPKEFAEEVMPKYFRQTKITSFQRQLNLYGFQRLTKGPDNGGYYHELFLRGKVFLSKRMTRTKVKGTGFKAASSPDAEPDFYKMPFVVVNQVEVTPIKVEPEPVTAFQEEYVNPPPSFQPPPPPPVHSRYTWTDPPQPTPQYMAPAVVSSSSSEGSMEPEDVLEDAVNEMLHEDSASVNKDDLMMDFATMWDPEHTVPAAPRIELDDSFDLEPEFFDRAPKLIENDAQLGELLEALLED